MRVVVLRFGLLLQASERLFFPETRPYNELLLHTDLGSQEFQDLLAERTIAPSSGRCDGLS